VRVRVSIVGQQFMVGDAERFLCDLLAYTDRRRIKWDVVCSIQPEFLARHPEIADADAEPIGGQDGVRVAMERSDLLIVWGGAQVPVPDGGPKVLALRGSALEAALPPDPRAPARTRAEVRGELKVTEDQRVVGFVGDLVNRNNPYSMIQALADLNRDEPGRYVGVFIGEGYNVQEIYDYSSRILGYEATPIRILGARSDIPALLDAVDVLLSPSVVASPGYDVLQAWQRGVPVVATPLGLGADAENHVALMLVPRAVENADRNIQHLRLVSQEIAERVGSAYSSAIAEIFTDEDGTRERVAQGRERVVHYGSDAFGERWTTKLVSMVRGAP
jgi:glycosyltransferase involved in cell wall biosynthesis